MFSYTIDLAMFVAVYLHQLFSYKFIIRPTYSSIFKIVETGLYNSVVFYIPHVYEFFKSVTCAVHVHITPLFGFI